ncbi:hypothetical protein VCHENC02_0177B, partial [Vibrio harveyi]
IRPLVAIRSRIGVTAANAAVAASLSPASIAATVFFM